MKIGKETLEQARQIAERYNRISSARGDEYGRMDADETTALALQLESMRARVYETQYPELKARLFIPVTNEDDPGAETVSYEETDEVGEAKVMANLADDFPKVGTSGTKVTFRVVSIGDSYDYTIQDIRRAAFMGKPLSARKALAARRAFERKLDSIAFSGEPAHGIASGFANNASVGIEPLAAAGNWATKTAQQILDDLNALSASVWVSSKELFRPTDVLLPSAQFLLAAQTRMSADNDQSVLEAFLRANPWVQRVDSWDLLEASGTAGADRAVAYARNPEVLELVIPQEFEVFPPQPKNLAFEVLCHGRTAGCHIYRPLGLRYMDGI